MNNLWLLYAASTAGLCGSILVYIVAYSEIGHGNVTVISWNSEFRPLSRKTPQNNILEHTIEWMSVNDRGVEKNISPEKPNQEKNPRIQGYALGWDYYEGQTSGARNLAGLQRWATSLNFGVVEPFVQESYFRTSAVFNNEKALRLSDYFDIDIWNHNAVTKIPHGTPLVSWEDFIKNAARQLIVVHVVIGSKNNTKVFVNNKVKKTHAILAEAFQAKN